MTNLTGDVARPYRVPAGGLTTASVPLAGYTNYAGGSTVFTVYKGAPVMCDVSDTDGYGAPKLSGINAASGDIFMGIALEKVSVTSSDTADGSKVVSVATNGVFGFPKGSIAITDIGAPCYMSDDATAQTSSTNSIAIGTIVGVDGTYAYVDISDYWMKPI